MRAAASELGCNGLPVGYLGDTQRRMYTQFNTLIVRGIQHILLSAFGCGAFKNDPVFIVNMYRDAISL